MTQCKEGSQKEGLMLDSSEELYKWFTHQIMRNLHVVFTMNPSSEGLKDRAATSPALFNRCVLNWFGDWSTDALYQVGYEFTNKVDLDKSDYIPPDRVPVVYPDLPMPPTHRQSIVNAFVYVHQTLYQANTSLQKRGGRTMAITPRHYLDFINHYVKLYNEKRQDLEEQQLHLNVGLQKIRETVEQVEELQASLSIKKNELEQKNTLANQKLKQMVHDQQEAEKKKITSQEIQEALKVQTHDIAQKKDIVLNDLSKVEPAVKEAQQAVKGIKKSHLVEVRALNNPHQVIKMALESICMLIGEPYTDWKSIRQIIMKENFIPTIANFSTEDITDDARNKMKRDYMSHKEYNFETVNHASKACGPLVKWAIAQLSYADMLKRVDPLRKELKDLETKAEETRHKGEQITKIISELEASIAKYKEEYAMLISDANVIKNDLSTVEKKVDRSKALLTSLSGERERWNTGSETFKTQMSTISGDVLLTSAFMAYGGYFDQQFRHSLFTSWATHLQEARISFRPDLARVEYLSNADERLRWLANSLPADDLCTENAIMIKRFNRYPLVVDPSGQATEFIMNEYKDKKITKTSFLDDAFRKNLESALRFGNPLLVQDVESYDPILNPVLNREVKKTGGRVLITLGDQEIDLSPSFTIFLSTRDPSVEFPPDLCSRVTFVNFTVTRSSLQSQCLNRVLKSERPDVDEKRSDLLKLQGEFLLRLRHLEKSLLTALNEVKGRILDDNRIITELETLKKEAAEVQRKMEETDTVMAEVDTVSQQYLPLSTSCSAMYFTLESLNQDFISWLNSVSPEDNVPVCWDDELPLTPVGKCFYQLLVIQTFRPDRLLAMGNNFVATVMGKNFMSAAEQELDLAKIVNDEVKSNTPVLLCSVPGYDASGRVDDLSASQNKQCTSIAIGSAEGFNLAEKAISSASKTGRWVLLKNVHLAAQWLVSLEKKLHSLSPHANFRLFLTMEINPKIPVNLLRTSQILTFEPPPGIKANLIRTFATVPVTRMCREPHERARLYFLLAWLHAILQERLRYAPLGWTKKYEFNESDLRMACDTLDTWLDTVAQGRTNLPPDKIPWSAFRTLLSQCIYGGRIDNDFDQRLLNSFVSRLFSVKSFEVDFPLVSNVDGIRNVPIPEGIRREQFLQWIENLPVHQTPSWLGLPNNAEVVLLTTKGSALTAKLLKMQSLSDDDDFLSSVGTTITENLSKKSDGRPAWMRTLHVTALDWLKIIPQSLNVLRRTADNIKDPLFRFFEREITSGSKLLATVRNDLMNVVEVCETKRKQTNYLRTLISDLAKGIIPRSWSIYIVPPGLTVLQWVVDFSERVKQLQSISNQVLNEGSHVLKSVNVWLGGLFTPEAYITATRQFVAQANSWSLEELFLEVLVDFKGQLDDCSFGVTGLRLQGAKCTANRLSLTATIVNELPLTCLKWVRVNPSEAYKKSLGKVVLPVYLNQTRSVLLFTLSFDADGVSADGDHAYYERGVAILSSPL
ncbi:PREDICTED: cytoplasmic dynein 1 heavy chain 1-like isoform X1 [Amphimedon queenslandica]|uniref:Uncharacterized protein n=1 Tax=Amphimedon queenslandica TaxID=400682 RepID=A0AAN0J9M5_AMPQE|nr:PREDICTED: cytoplasmic dynein 1 heavy chain 1-like isoform X1 [Amphimedon queenslandica]|eukprot:XP_019853431.1 PREDICTED: cytoplasmic dynein 1 heavy chain 1-like isoform X1 [Amphimedon queenslandica]